MNMKRLLLTAIVALISIQIWANPVDELLERIDKGGICQIQDRTRKERERFL